MRRPLNAVLRTPLLRALATPLVSPRNVDDYLELIDPCWSLEQVRARVLDVHRETGDVTSLLLEPNDNWRGHRAGQHVQLTVAIDGVQRMRSFSLSCAPNDAKTLRLTIKAHENGCVSRFVHERMRVGDVVTLSAAQGAFVLPERLAQKLLFVSGGSGLTPLVAMAQQLIRDGYRGDLVWLHYERAEVPLERELQAFARELPGMRLFVQRTGVQTGMHAGIDRARGSSRGSAPHLTSDGLTQLAADWHEREAFVCGPRALMGTVRTLFTERGLPERFHSEQFQPDWQEKARKLSLAEPHAKTRLVFAKSGIQSDGRTDLSLLEQAEHAGLKPLHGCRMGICHTCLCKKLSGSVRNELTGVTSDARDEEIQLCIHTPLSDVSLDL